MMQTFAQHYYLQEKLSSDIRRAFTSNLFTKRKVGVDLGRGKYKKVVELSPHIFKSTFNKFQAGAQSFYTGEREREALFGKKSHKIGMTSTIKKLSRTDITGVYEGEIDSGEDKIQGTIDSVVVYQIRNRSRIAFIISDNGDRSYIATNTKGNDFFRENLGTTLEQLGAESKPYLSKLSDDMDDEESESDEEPTPTPTKEPETSTEENEFGILDISADDYENLESAWGDGKKSSMVRGGIYPFKNKFQRERYFSNRSGYTGYKYFDDDGNTVYLINTNDGSNAFVAFKDRMSYDWTRRLGLLNFWRVGSKRKNTVDWKEGNIENNLE